MKLCARVSLVDHLVRKRDQRRRECDAERLRRLEVDHQLEFGRLHEWKVGRFLALENPPGVNAHLSIRLGETGTVADATAPCGKLAPNVHRGNRTACRECD